MRSLSPRQAQAVALFYLEDLSLSEIATTLGCTEGTVKTTLFRARTKLAELLATAELDLKDS